MTNRDYRELTSEWQRYLVDCYIRLHDHKLKRGLKSKSGHMFTQIHVPMVISEIVYQYFELFGYRRLVFPLTQRQHQLVADPRISRLIVKEVQRSFGTIFMNAPDVGALGRLVLNIQNGVNEVFPIRVLENRLGVLLNYKEISSAMTELGFEFADTQTRATQECFYQQMMAMCGNGLEVRKWSKPKSNDNNRRWVLIHNGRLYWKAYQFESNQRERSLHLTKVLQVLAGKQTKAFRNTNTSHKLPRGCCFSLIVKKSGKGLIKKATLDFSTNTRDECTRFVAYIKALQRHFINQANKVL